MIIDPDPNAPSQPPRPSVDSPPDYASAIRSHPPRDFRAQERHPWFPARRTNTRPPQPISYTFTSRTSDSSAIFLVESTSAAASSSADAAELAHDALYRISVSMDLNPFLPITYVTQVHREAGGGGGLVGEFVGKFELSLNQKRAVLTIGDTAARLSHVLSPVNASSQLHWIWNFRHIRIRWDCRAKLDDGSPMCICFASDSSMTQLASFIPPPPDASPPLPAPLLTVFPDGHVDDIFDHILISALVVERKMTH